ncbi:hypothetical protein [Streptomyces spiralis]|uniref:hypothetical protein n=1 Tax=Streptomyces spiralis TaxID=66376 RepID=UPI0036B236C3
MLSDGDTLSDGDVLSEGDVLSDGDVLSEGDVLSDGDALSEGDWPADDSPALGETPGDSWAKAVVADRSASGDRAAVAAAVTIARRSFMETSESSGVPRVGAIRTGEPPRGGAGSDLVQQV